MKHKLWLPIVAVITVLSLAALACGGGGGAPPTDTPVPTKAPKATSTTAAAEPTAVPTKAPKATATKESTTSTGGGVDIVNHSSYIDNYDFVHIVGLITNNTDQPITNIEMTIELTDAAGKSVLKDSDGNPADSLTFSPLLYTISPGDSSPFDYWTSTDAGTPDQYTVTVTNFEEGSTDRGELAIENAQMVSDSDGNWYFSGELVNKSDQPVQINSFAGAALDDQDNVLATDYTFAYTRYLWPTGDENGNDRTPFAVTMDGPVENATQWSAYWDADITDVQEPSGIEIDIANSYFDTYGSFHMAGTAHNTGNGLLSVSLVAGLYDKDDVVLDASSSTIPVYVGPDDIVPWHITYFPNVNTTKDQSALIDTFTVQVDRYWTYDTTSEVVALEAANEDVTDAGDGMVEAKGDVTNTSTQDLSSATVILAIYDENDNLVAMEYTGVYPEGDAIKPGDTLSFDVTVYMDPDVDTSNYTFTTIIQGYVK